MNSVLLDTNVLLSALTDRDLKQQERAKNLLTAADAGKVQLVLHQLVISELIYVLTSFYRVEVENAAETVEDFSLGLASH